jgi:hypothetical protein
MDFLGLIHSDNAVKIISNLQSSESLPDEIILESKTNGNISLAKLEQYKSNSNVVSATFILEYNGIMQGLTDEFIVKFKESTSYEQFQNLLSQYACSVIEKNQFVKNQFLLSVPKTSAYNSLQLSNLFYETGLFEFAEPNFMIINAFNSNDTYFNKQWGLKNTGQNGGITGIILR